MPRVDPDRLEQVSLDGPLRLHVTASQLECKATVWAGGRELTVTVPTSFTISATASGMVAFRTPASFAYFALLQ